MYLITLAAQNLNSQIFLKARRRIMQKWLSLVGIAFSLACARLGWSLTEIEILSLCGRDPALLNAVLYPGARILVLCADKTTPATVAQLLTQQGYGAIQRAESVGKFLGWKAMAPVRQWVVVKG
jgi:precorrin-6B methylase 1